MRPHRKHGIQKQYTLICPFFQISIIWDITAEIIMSLLILEDATRSAELFAKSANVYVRMAQADVIGDHAYIMNFVKEDLPSFRAE